MTGHKDGAFYRTGYVELCPYCGRTMDSLAHLTDDLPSPSEGDFIVCFRCQGLLVFADGRCRMPTASERAEAATNVEAIQTSRTIRQYWNTQN